MPSKATSLMCHVYLCKKFLARYCFSHALWKLAALSEMRVIGILPATFLAWANIGATSSLPLCSATAHQQEERLQIIWFGIQDGPTAVALVPGNCLACRVVAGSWPPQSRRPPVLWAPQTIGYIRMVSLRTKVYWSTWKSRPSLSEFILA